jgi:ribosomal protein L30/L7E
MQFNILNLLNTHRLNEITIEKVKTTLKEMIQEISFEYH